MARSTFPGVTCRCLSNYIRGRQSVTSCRGSKLSRSLFSFHLSDMPRPTAPVKRICYADDITVWTSICEISGTLPGYRECLSSHHQDGSSTKEIKGTIFTRHNQTVLPLLANNKKDTLQAIHTSFVNRATDSMTDNRVLNNRPPPINDEEAYLSRQRATQSQFHSGQCKLLYSYKND